LVGTVSLDFDDARRNTVPREHLVEQFGRDRECIAIVESAV
jgi:hypothetical protein